LTPRQMRESKDDIYAKFDVLEEDITTAANLAVSLHQHTLASVLWMQVAAVVYARNGHITEAVAMMKEMAEACCEIGNRYMKEHF